MKREVCMVIGKEMAALICPRDLERIKQGRGTGKGADYKPFIQTEGFMGYGDRTITPATKFSRCNDTLSNIEDSLSLLLDTSPIVADYYPNFPLDINITFEQAKKFGWAHPRNEKGKLTVMTSDFVIMMTDGSMKIRTVKDKRAFNTESTLRKLWLERTYWFNQGKTDWKIVTPGQIHPNRARNALLFNYSRKIEQFGLNQKQVAAVKRYCEAHLAEHSSLRNCTDRCDQDLKHDCQLKEGNSLAIAKHLIATDQWHWDMTVEFDATAPGLHRQLVRA